MRPSLRPSPRLYVALRHLALLHQKTEFFEKVFVHFFQKVACGASNMKHKNRPPRRRNVWYIGALNVKSALTIANY